jgi:hypothetical protein
MKKLSKNVIIAKSGIYEYKLEELGKLGLSLPEDTRRDDIKNIYNVFRPALVLSESASKFTKLPLLLKTDYFNHPDDFNDQRNWNRYAIGWTGDNTTVQWDDVNKEVQLASTVNIVAQVGLDAYEKGIIQVSPGYYGTFAWQKGTTSKGEEYDIIMTKISEADHLLVTTSGRGGEECRITDSKGGKPMLIKKLTGLVWQLKKKLAKKTGVGDAAIGDFRSIIDETIKNRGSLDDATLTQKTAELQNYIGDLPDNIDKELLSRYIDELPVLKQETDELALEAGNRIATLFEKLDVAAMQDVPTGDSTPVIEETTVVGGTQVADSELAVTMNPTIDEPIKPFEAIGDEGVDGTGTIPLDNDADDQVLKQIYQLLHKRFGSQLEETGDTTPAVTRSLSANPDKLEQSVTGSDKILPLAENKVESIGDSIAEDNSPVMSSADTIDIARESIVDIFKKF